MDKKNLDAIRAALKSAGVKTAAALRSLLAETDASVAAPAESLTARGRLTALFDEGTFMESGAYVRRRMDAPGADTENAFEGVICGWGSVAGRLVYAFSQDYSRNIPSCHRKRRSSRRYLRFCGSPHAGGCTCTGRL